MNKKGRNAFIHSEATKNLPFSVPEGYFDSLASRVQCRIQPELVPEVPPAQGDWVSSLRSQLAFAASFVLMAILSYFGYYVARPLAQQQKLQAETNYTEIVSRSIADFEDIDLYRAIERQRRQNSLDEASRALHHRYYTRSSSCITIIDERREVEP